MTSSDDFWSERSVPGSPSWQFFQGRALSRYRFAFKHVAGKHVLDVASGTGYGAKLLGTTGQAASVIGVEFDSAAVDFANQMFTTANVTFRQGDAQELSTYFGAAKFDTVVSMGTLEHIPDPNRFATQVKTVLKPPGVWLVTMLNPNVFHEPDPFHHQEYDLPTFRAFLARHFNAVELYGLKEPVDRRRPIPLPDSVKKAVKRLLRPAMAWRLTMLRQKPHDAGEYEWTQENIAATREFLAICRVA